MRAIKTYQPPGREAPMENFLSTLDYKLQKKLRLRFLLMSQTELSDLKEPHYKHFVLEKYNQFYELREKNKILVRIIYRTSFQSIGADSC